MHAPDLHRAGAFGMEVDIFSVGRKFGAVVEAGRGSEPRFIAAGSENGVDVEFAVALAGERERLTVGRPAVPIRRRALRDAARRASGGGHGGDARLVIVFR